MTARPTRPVLIIDDDPDAHLLARRALDRAGVSGPVMTAENGAEGISYLRRAISDATELPLFVFLDLKMPVVDGFQVLDWLRHQPALRRLITVVVSSSSAPKDVERAFALGADAYLPKFPSSTEIKTINRLASAMLSAEQLETALWPGIARQRRSAAALSHGVSV